MGSTANILQIGLLVVLLLGSGFFSASETSLMSLSKIRIRYMEDEGVKGAKLVGSLIEKSSDLLSSILVGNNIVNIAATSVSTSLFINIFGDGGVAIATAVMTVLVLVFGEITPKTIAANSPEKVAVVVSKPISIIMKITKPIVWVFNLLTGIIFKIMGIDNDGVKPFITEEELKAAMDDFKTVLAQGKDAAFVIRKGALSYDEKVVYKNDNTMMREDIIRHITDVSGEDPVISTTGKASRELFEIREAKKMSHKYDFLTVGSMGHSSSIALGVAESMPDTKIWCIDGDGAVLMHMGAMALLGANAPKNMVHVLINNGAHETVGGMPTVGGNIDWIGVAKSCGYPNAVSVDTFEALDEALKAAKNRSELSLIEVKCSIGAREDLGRPTTTALENKENFMAYLKELKG